MAIRHSNLGSVLTDLGDLAGARTHHERILAIGQATLRPNHPTMATFRDNLDHALQQLRGEEHKGDWSLVRDGQVPFEDVEQSQIAGAWCLGSQSAAASPLPGPRVQPP